MSDTVNGGGVVSSATFDNQSFRSDSSLRSSLRSLGASFTALRWRMTAAEAAMRAVIDEATPRASAMVSGEEQGCAQAGQKVLVLVLLSAHAAHALPRSESKSQPDSHYAT